MINFKKEGIGKKTLVFLHGWGGSWQSWAPIIKRIKNRFTIYALDLPGFGLSPLARPYNLAAYASDLEKFLKDHKIQKPLLIGHSFGGQVAAKFAINHSDLLLGLILVDAAVKRENGIALKTNIALAKLGKKIVGSKFRNLYYRLRGWEGSDYLQSAQTPNLQDTAKLVFRENISEEVSKISAKTLIFWGSEDKDTPVQISQDLKSKIPRSKLVVIPEAGHFSYLDAQEKFCHELIKFVNSL